MKQTTILPFYTTTNPKKSPLPFTAKTLNKAAFTKPSYSTSISSIDDLSPISKAHKTEQGGSEEFEAIPAKPMNKTTLRRSREVFTGITQSISKKVKTEAEEPESKQQTIKICLKNPIKITPSFKIAYLSQETADKSVLDSSRDQDASDLSFSEQDNRSSLLSLSPKPRDERKKFSAAGIHRFLACARKLDMDKSFFEETSVDEKCNEKESTVETAQISQKTMDLIKNLRVQYGLTRSVSTIEGPSKMVEEKENQPAISNKTMGLINLIKAKSVPAMVTEEPELEANDNETPTLKERFEELLGDKREFVMPVSYKRLLKAFEGLDKAVSMFGQNNFGKLKQCVENLAKREFTLAQLAQIMYVMPESYTVAWENNDLYLSFTEEVSQEKQEERRATFKNALLEITRKHHNDFLATLPEQERTKNYEKVKCWNVKFDVQACPAIPEAELPSEAKLLYKAETTPVVRQLRKLGRISNEILARVRATDQDLAQTIKNREFNGNVDVEKVKKIAESLEDYYTKRSVCSMFLINVIENLTESLGDVTQYIGLLLDLCPEWLSLEEVKEVHVLKMNKDVDMTTVYEKIQNRNN